MPDERRRRDGGARAKSPVTRSRRPASLKGVLSAGEAAAALAQRLRGAGAEAEELPLADGGEGRAVVLGGARSCGSTRARRLRARAAEAPVCELPDGTVVVESADAIPLDPVASRRARGLEPRASAS